MSNGFCIENGTLTKYNGWERIIVIPTGVTAIGDRAFYKNNSIMSVEIPEGVTVIGSEAFYACRKLSRITIPSTVTQIGKSAFKYCWLTTVKVPAGAVIDNAFDNKCTIFKGAQKTNANTAPTTASTTSYDGPFETRDKSLNHYRGRSSHVVIPDGVTHIHSAFEGNKDITCVTIPTSVTTIGKWAFAGCSNLATIIGGAGIKAIKERAFFDCVRLKSITIPPMAEIENNAFPKTCNVIRGNPSVTATSSGFSGFNATTSTISKISTPSEIAPPVKTPATSKTAIKATKTPPVPRKVYFW